VSRAEILRNGPLRALLAAEVISTTGAQMTWLALPWFVLVTTDSPAQMTLVMIAELVGLTAAACRRAPSCSGSAPAERCLPPTRSALR
jgi:hypothetical protein